MSNSDDPFTMCEGGLYCAEGVLKTIAEQAGIESELIPAIATGLCSGLARTCGPCGALTGGVLALNLIYGRDNGGESVEQNYTRVQELVKRFEHACGSTQCRELLGCDLGTDEGQQMYRENRLEQRCTGFANTSIRLVRDIAGDDL